MKTLTQYIRDLSISTMLTEASKPVKEFEAARRVVNNMIY